MLDQSGSILEVYWQSNQAERESGLAFYPTALNYCTGLAGRYDLGLERVVAACAALSPGLNWKVNRIGLERLLELHRAGLDVIGIAHPAYRANRVKAVRCLDGDLTALHGSKVQAFYQDILTGGLSDRITVDRWAARAAGIVITTWIHPALYRRLECSYLAAAERVGLPGSGLQAIIWLVIQRLSGVWSYRVNLNFAGGIA